MACARKFLCPFRQTLTLLTSSSSSISAPRQFSYAKVESLKALLRGVRPVLHNRASTFRSEVKIQGNNLQKFWFSGTGSKLGFGSIVGASVVLGSISFFPNVGYAMDALEILRKDDDVEVLSAADVERDRLASLLTFTGFYWMPIVSLIVRLARQGYSSIPVLAFQLILFLISTKPSPFSVYVVVEEVCGLLKHLNPHFYGKSLYARKVEVEDYKLLCLARVEIRDYKFTLVGILGGWWPLPTVFWRCVKDCLLYSDTELENTTEHGKFNTSY